MQGKVALVTGANRGIGFEVCRQLGAEGWTVILGCRDIDKGKQALASLKDGPGRYEFFQIDTSRIDSIEAIDTYIKSLFGRWDALVNNAGIYVDAKSTGLDLEIETLEQTLRTNLFGPLKLAQLAASWMRKQGAGSIVNVSSGMGQLEDMDGGSPAYRISKTALNAMTRILSAELANTGVLVNSVCPGWVRTDMGGPGAPRTIEQGADTIVWLANQTEGGPTGGFFRDRKPIAW